MISSCVAQIELFDLHVCFCSYCVRSYCNSKVVLCFVQVKVLTVCQSRNTNLLEGNRYFVLLLLVNESDIKNEGSLHIIGKKKRSLIQFLSSTFFIRLLHYIFFRLISQT